MWLWAHTCMQDNNQRQALHKLPPASWPVLSRPTEPFGSWGASSGTAWGACLVRTAGDEGLCFGKSFSSCDAILHCE